MTDQSIGIIGNNVPIDEAVLSSKRDVFGKVSRKPLQPYSMHDGKITGPEKKLKTIRKGVMNE